MATSTKTTTEDLRAALTSLALIASAFTKGRGMSKQRQALLEAIKKTNTTLRAEDQTGNVPDPETYIQNFLEQGGKWSDMVAAVSKNTLKGATFNVSQSSKNR